MISTKMLVVAKNNLFKHSKVIQNSCIMYNKNSKKPQLFVNLIFSYFKTE